MGLHRLTAALLAALLAGALALTSANPAHSQALRQTKGDFRDAFRQLDPEELPTPNDYRAASGAPGHRYWQQQVDYDIAVTLDEPAKSLTGRATIRYRNNSPDTLTYLWVLLDQDNFRRTSASELTRTTSETGRISIEEATRIRHMRQWNGGFTIASVTGQDGRPLPYDVVDTLMRVDLTQPLAPGAEVTFQVAWSMPFADTRIVGARSGYECFTKTGEDGNCLFLAAQWFPRLAAYSDFEGWHNKTFLGAGEFTLEFGDYQVAITVPSDFVVSSTGTLQNEAEVLTAAQRARMAQARSETRRPVYIVTPAEAAAAERTRASGTRTWRFAAENVRDFAFAGSRKYIWDAMAVPQENGPTVMAMSFFPKEGDPLWSTYSTQAVAHTIRVYGRMSFPYPYPTAQSVNGPVGGMEYPMITFNGPRPVKDERGNIAYSERTKYGLISVIIHEVGHIWFPMVVNSDERQWSWMDEGLNTFLQYVAEQEWSEGYPSQRGDPKDMVEYMRSTDQMPIMTQSDSINQFGANAYGKPATALVILRETIIGRERFDRAFREYSQRWRFRRPTPADFFRSMEESTGTDLDWFWRGWFYTTDHVDIAITALREGTVNTGDPVVESARRIAERDAIPVELAEERNRGIPTAVERMPELADYYDRTDPLAVTAAQRTAAQTAAGRREADERDTLAMRERFYIVSLANQGGLVMPVILKFTFADNTSETVRIPAEIWRRNAGTVNWTYVSAKQVVQVELDPRFETADVDRSDNFFPERIEPTRLDTFRARPTQTGGQMQDDSLTVTPDSVQTRPAATSTPAPARPR
jgi:hypothetical protein